MAAKYLHKKNVFLITLKYIVHYYYNGFEENIYIYIHIYIYIYNLNTYIDIYLYLYIYM